MKTSEFTDSGLLDDKIEILNICGATSRTFKRRIDGKLYFMKQLRPEYNAESRWRNAFFKEYEAGKEIESRYVVRYAGIEDDADGLYILMEYVNGMTIEEKLAKEPEYFTKPNNIKKLVTQLAMALEALHGKGIIHMDIKPENVMLTKTTNDVMLIDLGFCLSNRNDSTAGCTKSFAAPEAIAGNIGEIDAGCDIYSVGSLLQYIEEKSAAKLPRMYSKIMTRCMQAQKQRRFASAAEIIEYIRFGRKRTIGMAATIAIALLCACICFTRTDLYNDINNYIAWERGSVPSKFECDDYFYKITDSDARTVEITYKGNHPEEFKDEYEGVINIPPSITYRGRTFAVTSIDSRTFFNPDIKKVIIPEGIKTIKDSALLCCYFDGVIEIPASVEYIGVSAFHPMTYVKGLVVHKDNRVYDSREGCNAIIETATNTLIQGCNHTVIPHGVERIAKHAFESALGLEYIDIPASVKEIGHEAFYQSGITAIDIPESIKTFEKYTFQRCENLQKITLPQSLTRIEHAALSRCAFHELVIPDSVNFIGDYAFDYCERLKTVTLGCGVREIGSYAFDGCKRLKKVISHIPADKVFEINNSVFGNIGDDCVLYVPRGSKNAYRNTFGWNNFADIIEMRD